MTKKHQIAGVEVTYLSEYLGGTTAYPNGGTVTLSLPSRVNMIHFTAEGGAAYYAINNDTAGTAAPGYVSENGNDIVFPIDNLGTVKVYAAASVYVHTKYYESVG